VTGGKATGVTSENPDQPRGKGVDGGENASPDQRRRDRRSRGPAPLVQGSSGSGVSYYVIKVLKN
jgi:hypothetical protein